MRSCVTCYLIYQVLSVGMDGKMLVWKLDKDKGRLKLSNGYVNFEHILWCYVSVYPCPFRGSDDDMK